MLWQRNLAQSLEPKPKQDKLKVRYQRLKKSHRNLAPKVRRQTDRSLKFDVILQTSGQVLEVHQSGRQDGGRRHALEGARERVGTQLPCDTQAPDKHPKDDKRHLTWRPTAGKRRGEVGDDGAEVRRRSQLDGLEGVSDRERRTTRGAGPIDFLRWWRRQVLRLFIGRGVHGVGPRTCWCRRTSSPRRRLVGRADGRTGRQADWPARRTGQPDWPTSGSPPAVAAAGTAARLLPRPQRP